MTEQKIDYESHNVEVEPGEKYKLSYAIIVDEIDIFGGVLESYGLRVRMTGAGVEKEKVIHGITFSADEIERIIGLLSRGLVFPDDLAETLDNILG